MRDLRFALEVKSLFVENRLSLFWLNVGHVGKYIQWDISTEKSNFRGVKLLETAF